MISLDPALLMEAVVQVPDIVVLVEAVLAALKIFLRAFLGAEPREGEGLQEERILKLQSALNLRKRLLA